MDTSRAGRFTSRSCLKKIVNLKQKIQYFQKKRKKKSIFAKFIRPKSLTRLNVFVLVILHSGHLEREALLINRAPVIECFNFAFFSAESNEWRPPPRPPPVDSDRGNSASLQAKTPGRNRLSASGLWTLHRVTPD